MSDKSDPRHPENKLERRIYKDFHGKQLPEKAQELADQCFQEKAATPYHVLQTQIMDPRIPKNEREWWASRRIAALASENAKLRSLCAEAYKQGIYWRHGQEPEQRDWNKTWQALAGEEE